MNGLFAKLSATELRSQSGVCSSECTSYSCLKGKPEGQQVADVPNGCPYQAHSNAMLDNSICSLCTTWWVGGAGDPCAARAAATCRARRRRRRSLLPALRSACAARLASAPPRPLSLPLLPRALQRGPVRQRQR